jgi:hypothetical protein
MFLYFEEMDSRFHGNDRNCCAPMVAPFRERIKASSGKKKPLDAVGGHGFGVTNGVAVIGASARTLMLGG